MHQKVSCEHTERTFLGIHLQLIFPQALKAFPTTTKSGFGHHVIDVDFHKMAYHVMKHGIHGVLVSSPCILQVEWHYHLFVGSQRSCEMAIHEG